MTSNQLGARPECGAGLPARTCRCSQHPCWGPGWSTLAVCRWQPRPRKHGTIREGKGCDADGLMPHALLLHRPQLVDRVCHLCVCATCKVSLTGCVPPVRLTLLVEHNVVCACVMGGGGGGQRGRPAARRLQDGGRGLFSSAFLAPPLLSRHPSRSKIPTHKCTERRRVSSGRFWWQPDQPCAHCSLCQEQ